MNVVAIALMAAASPPTPQRLEVCSGSAAPDSEAGLPQPWHLAGRSSHCSCRAGEGRGNCDTGCVDKMRSPAAVIAESS